MAEYPAGRPVNERESGSIPRFDPEPSLTAALDILRAAEVPFALAGRLAVWMYVPPEGQRFTKDVDFAVPYGYADRVAEAARSKGYHPQELTIGGFGIRAGEVAVDFIDRHPHLTELFADAVKAAREEPRTRVVHGGEPVPVVPIEYVIAMKLVTHEPEDDADVMQLVREVPEEEYRRLQDLVKRYLGYASVQHLDLLARRTGHPGPGMRSMYKNGDPGAAGKGAGRLA
jgi:hypothetical protein